MQVHVPKKSNWFPVKASNKPSGKSLNEIPQKRGAEGAQDIVHVHMGVNEVDNKIHGQIRFINATANVTADELSEAISEFLNEKLNVQVPESTEDEEDWS